MNDPIETPDRRPLVYGGAAIVILLMAAYLFWPRTQTGSDLATADLTPTAVQTQASDSTTPIDPTTIGEDDVTEVVVDTETPVAEQIVDETPTAPTRSTETRATTTRSTPRESEPTRVTETPSVPAPTVGGPASTGSWVLNVGSFGSRDNAERQVRTLEGKGLAAHVHEATGSNGQTMYRVRVGYFASSAEAKAYLPTVKSRAGIEGWASKR